MVEVSSKEIHKARMAAKRSRAAVACARCKEGKTKCSGYRPCKRCTDMKNKCLEANFRPSGSTGCKNEPFKQPLLQYVETQLLTGFGAKRTETKCMVFETSAASSTITRNESERKQHFQDHFMQDMIAFGQVPFLNGQQTHKMSESALFHDSDSPTFASQNAAGLSFGLGSPFIPSLPFGVMSTGVLPPLPPMPPPTPAAVGLFPPTVGWLLSAPAFNIFPTHWQLPAPAAAFRRIPPPFVAVDARRTDPGGWIPSEVGRRM